MSDYITLKTSTQAYKDSNGVYHYYDAVGAPVDVGGKIQLVYSGTGITITRSSDGNAVNFEQIINYLKVSPNFTYLLYGNRAYLPSLIEDDDQGMHYIYFESTMVDGGMSKNAVIAIYSNNGVDISGINKNNVANENYNNKVAEITDRNKTSTGSYTSVKAVVDYVDGEINDVKDDVAEISNRVNQSVTPEMFGAYCDGIHSDTDAVQKCAETGKTIVFDGSKKYRLATPIDVAGIKSISVRGVNFDTGWYNGQNMIECDNGFIMSSDSGEIDTDLTVDMADITLKGNKNADFITGRRVAKSRFKNVTTHGFAAILPNMWRTSSVTDCMFVGCDTFCRGHMIESTIAGTYINGAKDTSMYAFAGSRFQDVNITSTFIDYFAFAFDKGADYIDAKFYGCTFDYFFRVLPTRTNASNSMVKNGLKFDHCLFSRISEAAASGDNNAHWKDDTTNVNIYKNGVMRKCGVLVSDYDDSADLGYQNITGVGFDECTFTSVDYPIHINKGVSGKDCYEHSCSFDKEDAVYFNPYDVDGTMRNAHFDAMDGKRYESEDDIPKDTRYDMPFSFNGQTCYVNGEIITYYNGVWENCTGGLHDEVTVLADDIAHLPKYTINTRGNLVITM